MAGAHAAAEKVKMAQGTVNWFNGDKGYGFTWWRAARTCSCTSARSRVAATAAWKIELDITQGPKGPQAEKVRVIA